ncbi:MAG: TonB-dependent receptor [Planctomycetota bacterium]
MNDIFWLCLILFTLPQENAELPGPDGVQTESATSRQEEPRGSPQKGDSPLQLKDLFVTATRTNRDRFNIPAFTDVVSSDDIRLHRLPRTLPEALEGISAVWIQKTGHGQGSPFLRGFTGFRTLFLIDGIRLNNSVFRDGPNQYGATVDPLSIDRLEVVKGPSSALYGSDAIGGTVNALTLEQDQENLSEGVSSSRRLIYRYSSAERAHSVRSEIQGNFDRDFAYTLGGSLKRFGEYRGGRKVGLNRHTDYDEYDWDLKLQYFANSETEIIFSHHEVDIDDAWRTHLTIYAEPWEGLELDASDEQARILDQKRELTYIRFKRENPNTWADQMNLTLSYHVQEEDRYRIRALGKGRDRQGFSVGTLGATVQGISPSPVGQWTWGMDYYRDSVDSFMKKFDDDSLFTGYEIQGPVADDAHYDLLGIYLQDEIEISERLDLILGTRYTFAAADADTYKDPVTNEKASLSDRWSHVVGNIKLQYGLDEAEHWNFFTGISQGFRAPNLSDLTRLDSSGSIWKEVPSPDLDPERYVSYEVGVKNQQENRGLQMAYFYTDIRDMIVRTTTGNLIPGTSTQEVTKKNSGKGYVHGIELGGHYKWHPQWTVFTTFTWMYGAVESYPTATAPKNKEPLSRVMPISGNLGLRWNSEKDRCWIEGVFSAADKADKLSTADKSDTSRIPVGGTPGYAVVHLRSGFRIMDDLTLSAAIENITNADYRFHGSGQNEPGRSLLLGLDWKF